MKELPVNPRAIACLIIHKIIERKFNLASLHLELQNFSIKFQNKRLVHLLCYGVFRHFFYLCHILKLYTKKQTKSKVKIIAIVGLYQVIFMHKPVYSCINETVSACNELNIEFSKSFINALLRRVKRDVIPQWHNFKEVPNWLFDKLKLYYPDSFSKIIENSNLQPPTFLRVNRRKKLNEFMYSLRENGIDYRRTTLKYCLLLKKVGNIVRLPLFSEGFFSIEDQSAQLSGHIIGPKKNERILDACAAPGGKSTHLLEICPEIELTMMDSNAERFKILKENLSRLKLNKLNSYYIIHDARKKLPISKMFDKILVDAPCSATGVIRRNPDVKILRTNDEVKKIVKIQQCILNNISQYLCVHGLLLYVTCSILLEENDRQIKRFLYNHPEFIVVDIPIIENQYKQNYGYQILPTAAGGDGFYYSLLKKIK